ncbi:hypothetical protein DQ04_00481080 [Trypanosoma grayi]|uniref:hypothetical protein n=1 Tax=Trypanosoma grayi TaxID=71804 RepID=UPI0004F47BA0|nr:hypothetical protein DQ04_00481080 [Trypanosoma grayi]KEG14413.1 hypothetical protein DQ04_00481080 [Trypanosoma grayi]
MNERTWVTRKRRPSTPPLLLASENVETTSSVVYEDPPFMQQNNSSSSHSRSHHRSGTEQRCAAEARHTRWCPEGAGWRGADRKALFMPWHRLEQDCEQAAARLLEISHRHNCCLTPTSMTPAATMVVNSQNSSQQPRFQAETLIVMGGSKQEETVGYGDGEDPAVKLSPAPQLASSTRPPSVDAQKSRQPEVNALCEARMVADNNSPVPSKAITPRSSSPPGWSDAPQTWVQAASEECTREEKEECAISLSKDDFTDASPILCVIIAPPAVSSAATMGDEPLETRFGRSCGRCTRAVVEERGQAQGGPHGVSVTPPCSTRSDTITPPVTSIFQTSSPASSPQPPLSQQWRPVERRTPPTWRRSILTPPRPMSEHPLSHAEERSPLTGVASKGGAAHRYYERHVFCTPPPKVAQSADSTPRPRDAIIVSWRGLDAHCKRTGLKSPVVPLLLRRVEGAS